MASASLKEELECSICRDIYKDPITLLCGHNFCRLCAIQHFDSQEELWMYNCPECRAEFLERPVLQKNLKLCNIVENFTSFQWNQPEAEVNHSPEAPAPPINITFQDELPSSERNLIIFSRFPEDDPAAFTQTRNRYSNRTTRMYNSDTGTDENDGSYATWSLLCLAFCSGLLLYLLYKSPAHLYDIPFGLPRNCQELMDEGVTMSGWYTIHPYGMRSVKVLCDMHTDGGGWIVFQRRVDGLVDFHRSWREYKYGFGSKMGDFWLGNDLIYQLTDTGRYQLRVDLEDFNHNKTYATYSGFKLEREKELYRLQFRGFTGGTAGDSLGTHKDQAFSTKDKDRDRAETVNCAVLHKGGWWYNACHDSNLNGLYLRGEQERKGRGVQWSSFKGSYYSLQMAEMKFRPE
ncbi:ficolin-1-A-like isoform X2 [Hyperolius riggenbachi]|uniref:ficolin-1-A-like isoform X2 n=1 Tax=Hyperolius riggenbachi TaxID=752182 RepID=UPI0035A2B7A4